jgi:hypothetical protein
MMPTVGVKTKRTTMNSTRSSRRSAMRAFISAKLAIVIAVIAVAGGLLAYDWHHADSAVAHHTTGHHHLRANAAGTN